jgi:hypothetical protein
MQRCPGPPIVVEQHTTTHHNTRSLPAPHPARTARLACTPCPSLCALGHGGHVITKLNTLLDAQVLTGAVLAVGNLVHSNHANQDAVGGEGILEALANLLVAITSGEGPCMGGGGLSSWEGGGLSSWEGGGLSSWEGGGLSFWGGGDAGSTGRLLVALLAAPDPCCLLCVQWPPPAGHWPCPLTHPPLLPAVRRRRLPGGPRPLAVAGDGPGARGGQLRRVPRQQQGAHQVGLACIQGLGLPTRRSSGGACLHSGFGLASKALIRWGLLGGRGGHLTCHLQLPLPATYSLLRPPPPSAGKPAPWPPWHACWCWPQSAPTCPP